MGHAGRRTRGVRTNGTSLRSAPATSVAGGIPSPARTWAALAVTALIVFVAIEAALGATLGPTHAPSLRIALFFVGYDVAVGVVLMVAIGRTLAGEKARRAMPLGAPPPISVLVSAYDEQERIVETVRALAAQRGVEFEILVGDDGSIDGTHEKLIREFRMTAAGRSEWAATLCPAIGTMDGTPTGATIGTTILPTNLPTNLPTIVTTSGDVLLRVLRLPHAGKGATLNALAARARHPVLVTLDADTLPASGALGRLAGAFVDEDVDCAAGVVTVRNGRDNWLTHHQSAEYLKNALVRIGWAALGGLEQVPGAFAAIRATAFVEAGGFPTDSLTEDYELTFRLIASGVRTGRAPRVVTVPSAQVFTEAPRTVAGFIRQRTRWFAGFLSTLVRFRSLIFEARAGGFGLVRLPLKIVDALLPVIALSSLIVLVRGGLVGRASLAHAALLLFALRWLWDLLVYALAVRAGHLLGDARATRAASPSSLRAWACAATEAVTFIWLKHAAALRGYIWAARRLRTWESARHPAKSPPAAQEHLGRRATSI